MASGVGGGREIPELSQALHAHGRCLGPLTEHSKLGLVGKVH